MQSMAYKKTLDMNDEVLAILRAVERGEYSAEQALQDLIEKKVTASHRLADTHLDLDRKNRCGFPEVVYGEGKSPETIIEIFQTLLRHNQPCLATRIDSKKAFAILELFPLAIHNEVARTVRLHHEDATKITGKVAVISAGTSDRPVAEEALETLRWMQCETEFVQDVGVAGPHRLAEHIDRFQDAKSIVVVAGMEGALPSVVGGYVACPVIAVPTSVGYGASFQGVTALLGMLNSCASNVTVVNIDAGFKGGYVAGLIAKQAIELPNSERTED